MKLRDLKPGMLVAVGNHKTIKAWGLGYNCRRVLIVDKGKYRKCDWKPYKQQLDKDGDKTQLLVAYQLSDGWRPDVIRSQDVIMLWDEYEEAVEKSRKERSRRVTEQKHQKRMMEERLATIQIQCKPLGVAVAADPRYSGQVLVSFDDIEKLIKLASLYRAR